MSTAQITVLYPHPTDPEAFDADYAEHLKFLHEKTGIPADAKPYTVTKFAPTPDGPPPYYQMFVLPFPSVEDMQGALASAELQAVAADAVRISSGGAPQILVGMNG